MLHLQQQAFQISKMYPIGSSLFKIMESRILMKQLYYTLLNDIVLVLFPELKKWLEYSAAYTLK